MIVQGKTLCSLIATIGLPSIYQCHHKQACPNLQTSSYDDRWPVGGALKQNDIFHLRRQKNLVIASATNMDRHNQGPYPARHMQNQYITFNYVLIIGYCCRFSSFYIGVYSLYMTSPPIANTNTIITKYYI